MNSSHGGSLGVTFVHARSGCGTTRHLMPAHSELRKYRVRIRDGDAAGIQRGAGDTVTPTIVNLFGFQLLEIPLAWWLALRAGFASNGVFFPIVIAEAAIAGAGVLLFRQGRWKMQKI